MLNLLKIQVFKELLMDQNPVQPQQQTPQQVTPPPAPQPPASKSTIPTVVIAVVVSVVVVFALIIGFLYFLGKSSDSSDKSSGIETVKKEAKLGSTIELDKIEVSVGDIEKKSELDQYQQAPDGKEYVLTYIKVSNGSKGDVSVGSAFELRTKENKVEYCSAPFGDDYKKFDQQIAPEGETEGDLYCEISKDDDVKSINFKAYGSGEDYTTYQGVFTN